VRPSRAANRWNVRTDTTTRAALEALRAGASAVAWRSDAAKSATSFSPTSPISVIDRPAHQSTYRARSRR
jgi:hypothetical protein